MSKSNHEKILNKLVYHNGNIKNSVIEDGYIGVYRNEAYMNYKTYSNTYVINLNSSRLWLKVDDELIIGDIKLKENNRKYFFEEIKVLAKKLNLTKISFQVSGGCRLHDCLQPIIKLSRLFLFFLKILNQGWI